MAWTMTIAQGRASCAFIVKTSFYQTKRGGMLPSTQRPRSHAALMLVRLFTTTSSSSTTTSTTPEPPLSDSNDEALSATKDLSSNRAFSPWNNHFTSPEAKNEKVVVNRKFRQHVNPLALRYQQPTILSPQWPNDVFRDTSLPLILDIGCGKGGFLLDLAQHYVKNNENAANDDVNDNDALLHLPKPAHQPFNYLGLEIRPPVVRYAQSRIEKHGLTGHLDYVGCNANIDLERLLHLYHDLSKENVKDETSISGSLRLHLVTIQFPDPHFKSHHVKRRVVTPQLVETIYRYMPQNATVFLQSDVKNVLDDMRLQFRQSPRYLQDVTPDVNQYVPENVLGVSTERERSVLKRNLPVYRAVFRRTDHEV